MDPRPRLPRLLVPFVSFGLVFALAFSASAAERVRVGDYDGRGAKKVRYTVVKALQKAPKGKIKVDKKASDARWVFEGNITRQGKTRTLTLHVRDSNAGEVIYTATFTGKSLSRLRRAITRGLWKTHGDRILAAIKQASAPPPVAAAPRPTKASAAPAPAPAAAPTIAAVAELEDEDQDRPVALSVALGGRFFTRSLSYNDDAVGAMYAYDLNGAPAIALDLAWFPGAHFTDGAGAHFGIAAHAHFGFGVDSATADGTTYGTTIWGAEGALVGRIPIDAHEITIHAGYGADTFEIGDGDAPLPSPSYGFVKTGADARFAIGDVLAIDIGASWLFVTGIGSMADEDWFPDADVGALDARAGVSVGFGPGLGARLGFDFRRYAFDMNAEPGDRWAVGGATDQYLIGSISLTWRPKG